ncbi:hypothetical protein BV898_12026 [Hypsibius exemplaris]|uniref:G-protein coupled receptors family 1 profile domain-containing protein n=1 Tax=Hypsibius exemplaris TaxID=2072580 RepID=A0A1W0WF60_HYPEX|nr:hypothetical protein BV898_12026 [Hypsibius exemplaris]
MNSTILGNNVSLGGLLGNSTNGSLSATGSCNWPPDNFTELTVEKNPTLYADLVFYPILLFICTVGNILNIAVLSTDVAKTTTNVYLICLAVSDLCVLWLYLPSYLIEANPKLQDNEALFKFHGFGKWWEETAIQFSDWTLIVFSLERLFAIAKPLQYRSRLTISRAVSIELAVVFLAALSTLQNMVDWYYFMANDDGVSKWSAIIPPSLRRWKEIQEQAEISITIGKWIALTVINITLIIIITRHNMTRKDLLSHYPAGFTAKAVAPSVHPAKRRSTHVLIGCSALYFVTQFPNVVYKILEVASRPPYCSYNFTPTTSQNARPIISIILLSNYSANFILYCLMWSKFRHQLHYLVCRTLESVTSRTNSTADTTPEAAQTGKDQPQASKMSPADDIASQLSRTTTVAAESPNVKVTNPGFNFAPI